MQKITNALKSFVEDLINQYATKDMDEGYMLWTRTLYSADKKILLSHFCDANEYEWYCSSPERFEAGFDEHDKEMQSVIDSICLDMYWEDMHENGFRVYKSYIHGDFVVA